MMCTPPTPATHRHFGDPPSRRHPADPSSFRRRPESIASGGRRLRRRIRSLADDQRGVFAPFIAIIAAALLFLGGIAYDAPRLTAARQDALHAANEAARVAAATIASGGTVDDARTAAGRRLALQFIYGERVLLQSLDCVGTRVQITVETGYVYRSIMRIFRNRQPIEAIGAAEAYLVLPDDSRSELSYLGECPLQ